MRYWVFFSFALGKARRLSLTDGGDQRLTEEMRFNINGSLVCTRFSRRGMFNVLLDLWCLQEARNGVVTHENRSKIKLRKARDVCRSCHGDAGGSRVTHAVSKMYGVN